MQDSESKKLISEIKRFVKANPDLRQVEVLATDICGHFFGKRYPIGKGCPGHWNTADWNGDALTPASVVITEEPQTLHIAIPPEYVERVREKLGYQ